MYYIRILFVAIVVLGCTQPPELHGERAIALHLFQLMNKRLSFMKEVAASKFLAGVPIEDTRRENVVIQNAIERAADYQLEAKGVQALVEAQIKASKDIQEYYFKKWQDSDTQPEISSRDLQSEIRPRLAAISREIIDTLGLFLVEGGTFNKELEKAFYRTVTVENLSSATQKPLFEALRRVREEREPLTKP